MPACPSGVRYDLLIERTRAKRRVEAPVSPRNRVIDAVTSALFTRPRLLRAAALPLAAGIRPMALAPRVSIGDLRAGPPRYTPARGRQKQSAALLEGCVQSVFFGRVNAASVKALAADGCECVVPPGQGCCGALALHSGRDAEARRRAQQTVETFSGYERVVVTAAGCGSAMKGYGELLGTAEAHEFSAAVRDVNELLAELDRVSSVRPGRRRGSCTRTHATSTTVRELPASRARCWPGFPGWSWSRSSGRECAAVRPGCKPDPTGGGAGSSACARPARSSRLSPT